jgi:segregation and condensation protein B
MEQAEIRDIINAVILASSEPISYDKLLAIFPADVNENQIKLALSQLLKMKGSVQHLVKVAGGYQFQIKKEFAPWIVKAKGEQELTEKLSRVALETLAIIAYKQPVSKGEIETMRGGSLHATALPQLEEKGWIQVVGYAGANKRTMLYGTTRDFLLYFGLNSVHELPSLESNICNLVDTISEVV